MHKYFIGNLIFTRGINDKVAEDHIFAEFVLKSISRHSNADWGDLDDEDKRENDFSLSHGLRILSAYTQVGLPKIWIITEADRSITTVLFPEEY